MTYQEENDQFLFNLLDQTFFVNWKKEYSCDGNRPQKKSERSLQINVTYECNQRCEYCYLIKHGDKLYPKELEDQTTILNNLDILLNWCGENYPNIPNLEIFSGEIWHSSFGLELLDRVYNHCPDVYFEKVVIPSNMSFILDDEQTQKIQDMIDKFKKINVIIQFSASVDGLLVEDYTRPMANKKIGQRNQDFYDKLFKFCVKNGFYAHPMLSAFAIEHWQGNYVWWYKQCSKFDLPFLSFMMLLEVRDNDWTEEKLAHYNSFLKFQFKFILNEIFHGDKELMMLYVFGISKGEVSYQGLLWGRNDDKMTCTISNYLAIRLGDLSITPCHRTSYPQFLYGKFKVEDKKIVGIKANNIQLPVHLLCNNMRNSIFGCDTCAYKVVCLRQCLGVCYENNNDILMPVEGVCKFMFNKYERMMGLIEEYGILDQLINSKLVHDMRKKIILNDIKLIKEQQQ